jgi:plastocyanin
MRKLLLPFVSMTMASCGGDSSPLGPPPTTTTAEVFTPGNTFSPFSTTIGVGGTVTFRITGVPHNVIFSAPGSPANVNVVSNTDVSRTFSTRGTFPYDCTVHPGMSGQIVVQ